MQSNQRKWRIHSIVHCGCSTPILSNAVVQLVAMYPRKNMLIPIVDCAAKAVSKAGCVGVCGMQDWKWSVIIISSMSRNICGMCWFSPFFRSVWMISKRFETRRGWGHWNRWSSVSSGYEHPGHCALSVMWESIFMTGSQPCRILLDCIRKTWLVQDHTNWIMGQLIKSNVASVQKYLSVQYCQREYAHRSHKMCLRWSDVIHVSPICKRAFDPGRGCMSVGGRVSPVPPCKAAPDVSVASLLHAMLIIVGVSW